jgi:hypothetical protein
MKIKLVRKPDLYWKVRIPRFVMEDQGLEYGKSLVEIEINGMTDTRKLDGAGRVLISKELRESLNISNRKPIQFSVKKIEGEDVEDASQSHHAVNEA